MREVGVSKEPKFAEVVGSRFRWLDSMMEGLIPDYEDRK